MGEDFYIDIANKAVRVTLLLSAPMLIGALLTGIIISIFQAVTQINEQTLSFIPKIIVIVGAVAIFSPWLSEEMTTFTKELILDIPRVVSGR